MLFKVYYFQGFPCNQFARQEPAANATELYLGMAWVRPGLQRGYNFKPDFPLTQKISVNGEDSHPIFNYLKVSFFVKLRITLLHIFDHTGCMPATLETILAVRQMSLGAQAFFRCQMEL